MGRIGVRRGLLRNCRCDRCGQTGKRPEIGCIAIVWSASDCRPASEIFTGQDGIDWRQETTRAPRPWGTCLVQSRLILLTDQGEECGYPRRRKKSRPAALE